MKFQILPAKKNLLAIYGHMCACMLTNCKRTHLVIYVYILFSMQIHIYSHATFLPCSEIWFSIVYEFGVQQNVSEFDFILRIVTWCKLCFWNALLPLLNAGALIYAQHRDSISIHLTTYNVLIFFTIVKKNTAKNENIEKLFLVRIHIICVAQTFIHLIVSVKLH